VADEHVIEVGRLSTDLAVKVEASWGKSSLGNDVLHALGGLLDVHWELIGVPTKEWISGVGVDAAQHTVLGGNHNIMFVVVTSKSGVVWLDV
jgi:hypothetical protein